MSLGKRMAASFNFHFKGNNQLVAALNERADLDLVREALRINGAELQSKAMRKAPVDTGNLKRGITIQSDLADRGMTIRVTSQAEYSPYVEYGTRYMAAKPFMRPAYKEQKAQFKADMKRIMGR